jgi:NTE family protein
MTGSGTSALVLGGGGITGIAWELGILAGLAEAGVDLTDADIVVGTSAGSVVGAQVTNGLPIEDLYATQLEPPDAELGGRLPR